MFRNVLCIFLVLFAALSTQFIYAQEEDPYADISHAERQIGIGIAGAGDDTSLSATAIFPINQDNITDGSWAGVSAQQQSGNGEVTAQVLNAHAVVGYDLQESVSINVFGDWSRDKERGIAGQTRLGGFLNVDFYEERGWRINGGAGNFLENKQAQEDLERKATDPNVVRALGYVKVRHGRYSARFEFTPKLDFSHPQFVFKPKASYTLSDTLSLVALGTAGYDSEPLVEGEEFYTSYQLQFSSRF